ncbi:MAG: TolB family protein, partial [Armatimonadota bacterium]
MTSRICSKAPLVIACLVLLLLTISVTAVPLSTGSTAIVSLSTIGVQGNDNSLPSVISANGKYVAFVSDASNLVDGDTNGVADIFVRDLTTGETERVSVSSTSVEANGASSQPAISADGRYIAFSSYADNLVDTDTNLMADIFIRDIEDGTTVMVSLSSTDEQGDENSYSPSISADGNIVAFASSSTNLIDSDTNNTSDVFVRNIFDATTDRVSVSASGIEANYDSHNPSINSDGTRVAFYSYADNLVADDTNIAADVFVKDLISDAIVAASVSSDEVLGDGSSINPSISPDGEFVAFESIASNLTFGDINGLKDIFVRNLDSGTTFIVSISSGGTQGDAESLNPSISSNGKFITFWSTASNFVAGDTNSNFDVFVRDFTNSITERISIATESTEANNGSGNPSISADGRFVSFTSYASNLIVSDTNDKADIFLRDRAQAPINTSLTPNTGDIMVEKNIVLSTVVTDSLGADNIKSCYLLVNTSFSNSAGYLFYDALKNKLYLRSSDSTALLGGFIPGKSQIIDNGFMVLNCRTTSVQRVGNTLTINWNVTFKPGFAGSVCEAWMRVTNKAGLVDPWELMGTFSMVANPAPKNVSLTPNSGTITIDTPVALSSVYSDPAGFSNIKSCYMMVNTGTTTSGAGYFLYDPV